MNIDDSLDHPNADESYFDEVRAGKRVFDARLLREPVTVLPVRSPLFFSLTDSATDAMRAMQRQHRGVVLVTEDGTQKTQLRGIFTERDVLVRIIDRGRNPATLELGEVMTADPETLPAKAQVSWVLNMMSVGGFRHVPVVDDAGRPVSVVSVRDVVQFLVEAFPNEILNLPPEFDSGTFRTRGGA
ncbi:MAG: CBS domain-containing protein [Proteobacteria bacterium]|nr:CBS domain-containing protein [Pseudomonadota bacterium]